MQSTGIIEKRADYVVVQNTENDHVEQVPYDNDMESSENVGINYLRVKNIERFHDQQTRNTSERTRWNVVDYHKLLSETKGDPFKDIPQESYISLPDLVEIHKQSIGSGNFAKKITERLFPELYGPDGQRIHYSYFGGGPKHKHALDPARKGYIKRYVTYFHPELKNIELWKLNAITKINESLRRPVVKAKSKVQEDSN